MTAVEAAVNAMDQARQEANWPTWRHVTGTPQQPEAVSSTPKKRVLLTRKERAAIEETWPR